MADEPTTPLFPPPNLVEIPTGEWADYYFERYGRLFPRHLLPVGQRDAPDAPLPCVLPVDAADMKRREVQNNLVCMAVGRHWFGPFREHFNPPQGKLVVDIGCANGKWIEYLLEDEHSPLHEVQFRGIECVPFSTELPHNVTFVVADFQRDGIPQEPSTADVVHARFQNFHVRDWDGFIKDMARVLKPGGLVMSGELDIPLEAPTGQPFYATATSQLYNDLQRLMRERGYNPNAGSQMVEQLQNARNSQGVALFTDIHSQVIPIPMGRHNSDPTQREISVLSMEYLDSLAKSLRAFLLSTGTPSIEIDGLLTAHRRELRTNAAQMKYRIAWARRT